MALKPYSGGSEDLVIDSGKGLKPYAGSTYDIDPADGVDLKTTATERAGKNIEGAIDFAKQGVTSIRRDIGHAMGTQNPLQDNTDYRQRVADIKAGHGARVMRQGLNGPDDLDALFQENEGKYHLDAGLLNSMAKAESNYNVGAVSDKGARGIMQLMPGTADRFHVKDSSDPVQAIDAAGQYMRILLNRYDDDKEKAVAAYNWGEGNLDKHLEKTAKAGVDWRTDLPTETRGYIAKVLGPAKDRMSEQLYGLPLKPGYIDAVRHRWDQSTPEQRAKMLTEDGAAGRVAQEIERLYKQADDLNSHGDPVVQSMGTRVEDRALNYMLQGADRKSAFTLASQDAALGVMTDKLSNASKGNNPLSILGESTRSFGQGVSNLKQIGYGLGAWGADVLGDELATKRFVDDYQALDDEASKMQPSVGTMKQIRNPDDAARWAVNAIYSNLPMMLPSLVTGGVTGTAAKAAAEKTFSTLVERFGIDKATQLVAKKVAMGAGAGAAASSIGMETGSIYGDIQQQTGQGHPWIALAGGVPAGVLDALPEAAILKKMLGPAAEQVTGGLIKRYGMEAAKQILMEGPTEGAQTAIERASAAIAGGQPFLTQQTLDEIIESMGQGAIAGGVMGVAGEAGSNLIHGNTRQVPKLLDDAQQVVNSARDVIEDRNKDLKASVSDILGAENVQESSNTGQTAAGAGGTGGTPGIHPGDTGERDTSGTVESTTGTELRVPGSPADSLGELGSEATSGQTAGESTPTSAVNQPEQDHGEGQKGQRREKTLLNQNGASSGAPITNSSNSDGSTNTRSKREQQNSDIRSMGGDDLTLRERKEQELQKVRGQGDKSLQGMEGGLSEVREGHGSKAEHGSSIRQGKSAEGLRAGELPVGNDQGSASKQIEQPSTDNQRENTNGSGVGRGNADEPTNDTDQTTKGMVSGESGTNTGQQKPKQNLKNVQFDHLGYAENIAKRWKSGELPATAGLTPDGAKWSFKTDPRNHEPKSLTVWAPNELQTPGKGKTFPIARFKNIASEEKPNAKQASTPEPGQSDVAAPNDTSAVPGASPAAETVSPESAASAPGQQLVSAAPGAPVQGSAEPVTKHIKQGKPIDRTIDPAKDSILAAIAKSGGISLEEGHRQGIDKPDLAKRGHKVMRVFTKTGMTFDDMAHNILAPLGYPVTGANDLLEAIDKELRGQKVHTPDGAEAAGQRADQQQAEDEAAIRAEQKAREEEDDFDPFGDSSFGSSPAFEFEEDSYHPGMDAYSRRMYELGTTLNNLEDGEGDKILERGAIANDDHETIIKELRQAIRQRIGDARARKAAEGQRNGTQAKTQETEQGFLEAQQQPAAKEQRPVAQTDDLFGNRDDNAQAIADAKRAKDAKRNGENVAPGAGEGTLFGDESKQTDITDVKPESAETKKARENLEAALSDLGHVFLDAGFFTKKAVPTPEIDEAKLIPVLARVLDASFQLGYQKFKDAARFAIQQIRERFGDEPADAITLDHLQGSYIAMAGKYQGKGADTKRAVIDVESLDELLADDKVKEAEAPNNATEHSDQQPGNAEVPAVGEQGDGGESGRPDDTLAGSGASDSSPSDRVLETGATEDVRPPKKRRTRSKTRRTADVQGVEAGGPEPDSGDSVAGSPGTGGTGVVDAGPGESGELDPITPEEAQDDALVDGGDKTKPSNFHIDDPESLIGGTPKRRFARNRAAIETYNNLLDEGREPTPEEQATLSAYIGWGSFGQELFQGSWERPVYADGWKEENDWLREHLGQEGWKSAQASIINAHYTDPPTVQAMWDIAQQLGFKGGRVLEPSMGIGNFFGLMPRDLMSKSDLTGIEMDRFTGGMAKMLYPDANIQIKPYQDSKTADNFYDLIIGNWPFAKDGPADRRYNKLNPSLHDYFFLKALDQVRPGGLVIGITSAGTMDKKGKLIRAAMAEKANLVAAFRLPMGAFEKYAGTKVVTDIIVLQKKGEGVNPAVMGNFSWLASEHVIGRRNDRSEVTVNDYWTQFPSHVLGDMKVGHGTTQGRDGMIVERRSDFPEQLADLANSLPKDIMTKRGKLDTVRYITNNTKERQNSIVVADDGGLYVVKGERLAALEDLTKIAVKSEKETNARRDQIKRLAQMGKAYGALLDGERAGAENVEDLRKELRNQYDAFVKAHGNIRASYGIGTFGKLDDPMYPALASLESIASGKKGKGKKGDATAVYEPSAILFKSTIRSPIKHENPSIRDAFVLVRNEQYDTVDVDKIAELSKQPVAKVVKDLTESGAIFKTPAGPYEVSDIYLSGNVRRKLREALDAQQNGQDMARNIESLKKVLPKTIPYFAIEAKLGAPWVSAARYSDFVSELLNLNKTEQEGVSIIQTRKGWRVHLLPWMNNKPEAQSVWGTAGISFSKILRAAFNNTTVTIRYRDDDGVTRVDEEASALANGKVQAIREEFGQWIWRDAERRVAMENAYNEVMNAIAEPQFDGSFLNFEGMALQRGEQDFNLRKHQIDAIWRGVANGRGIYAHEVGTGKTLTMGGICVESRRYGIARKPMILAHNANSASVATEIQQMYPSSRVLYIDNLSPDTIKERMYQIANDDWDAIVVPHSVIDKFALTRETLDAMTAAEIMALEEEAIAAAQEDGITLTVDDMNDEEEMKKKRSVTAKELVKIRNNIIRKNEQMAQRASREDAISFEHLGVDMLLIDEAHEFKKPPLTTRMRVKGLNVQTSGQSLSLHLLSGYIRQIRGNKGVHVFTGTPITNTLNEIYNQMRYVMAEDMEEAGVYEWDSWFNTFADSATDVELTPTGEYEPTTRLSAFVNVAELRRMAGQVMHIVFADEMPEFSPRPTSTGKTNFSNDLTDEERAELLNGRTENPVGRPYKKIVNDSAPLSDIQRQILDRLMQLARMFRDASKRDRYQMVRSGHEATPIRIEDAAAKAGFDQRRYNLALPEHPESKVNRCVRNVVNHYQEHPLATQAIFMETGYYDHTDRTRTVNGQKITTREPAFNVAKDIIEKLVAAGIPREQIALVTGSTSKEKRKEIADAMNRSEVRVVIGSTATLGVGVNMQVNLRAMHHLDAPWMPGELEQRNGRGHRQGNKWNTVLEYRYLTEGLDGRRWQVLAIKQKFITAFLKSDENTRVIEGDAVSLDEGEGGDNDLAESLSAAAGDPRILIREKLKGDVHKLESKKRMHDFGIVDATGRADELKSHNERLSGVLEKTRADALHWDAVKQQPFSIKINGKTYTERKDADEAIRDLSKDFNRESKGEKIGEFRGFEIRGRLTFTGEPELIATRESTTYTSGSLGSLEGNLRNLSRRADDIVETMNENERSIAALEQAAKTPFSQEKTLVKKKDMLDKISRDIEQYPVPAPSWMRDDAPIGTDAYLDSEQKVTIQGHRWGLDNWYVLIDDGKDSARPVPYTELRDENNLPIFEPRLFSPPGVNTQTTTPQAPQIPTQPISATTPDGIGSGDKVIDPDGNTITVERIVPPLDPDMMSRESAWRIEGIDEDGNYHVIEANKVAKDTGGRFSRGPVLSRANHTWTDVKETEYGPEFVGQGITLTPVEKINPTFDANRDRFGDLGLTGHHSWVTEGSTPTYYVILDKDERFAGTLVADVKDDSIVNIHDIRINNKANGIGTNVVRHIVANARQDVSVTDILPGRAENFWTNRIGVQYVDHNRNSKVGWQDIQAAYGRRVIENRQGSSQATDSGKSRFQKAHRGQSSETAFDHGRGRLSPESVEAQLRNDLGRGIARWLNSGKLKVVQSEADLAKATGMSADRLIGVKGYQNHGNIILVADNLSPAEIRSVALHEAFHAIIASDPATQRQLGRIYDGFKETIRKGQENPESELGRWISAAHGEVFMAATPRAQRMEEMAAYTIGQYENSPRSLPAQIRKFVADLIAAVRMALVRARLFTPKTITPADLSALARAWVRSGGQAPNITREAPNIAEQAPNISTASHNRAPMFSRQNPITPIAGKIAERLSTVKSFNWWHKSVGSQFHKAMVNPYFRQVFQASMEFELDVARLANETADLAPSLLPKLDSVKDAAREVKRGFRRTKDAEKVAEAIFSTTLNDKLYSDVQLANQGYTPEQRTMYRQFFAAVNKSLDDLAKSEMFRAARAMKLQPAPQSMTTMRTGQFYFDQVTAEVSDQIAEVTRLWKEKQDEIAKLRAAGKKLKGIKSYLRDEANERARIARAKFNAELKPLLEELRSFKQERKAFIQKAMKIEKLKAQGYAPLMRFGRYTVDVVDQNSAGSQERVFFGMFEDEQEAKQMARVLQEQYPNAMVTRGVMSQNDWQMFRGITPETMEVMARMMGADQDEAFQTYLKTAVNNRSAMKRLIHRQKIPGFVKDPQRILASFITSNARASSKNLHLGELVDAITAIPKQYGDVVDEAVDLYNFVQNPAPGGTKARALLFAWYLGGSISSAAINLTQTFTTTTPFLAQFGTNAQVTAAIGAAMKLARLKPSKVPGNLGKALMLAEEEGITAPHELHMLYGESMRTGPMMASKAMRPFAKAWGSLFSVAEAYNRRVAFIAAYKLGVAAKKPNPFKFAADAVNQTQFIYSKTNRPNWARSSLGSTVFTFKAFTINYLEFLKRLPTREKAIALGVLILFAGVNGLPGGDDADDLIDTLGQYLGYNTNAKEWRDEFLTKWLGRTMSGLVQQGLSSVTPIDLSSRLGVGNVIPGSALLKRSETDKTRDVMEFAGPAGSLLQKAGQAIDAASGRRSISGKIGAVAEAAMPKALADLYRAIDMMQTGQYRDYLGRRVADVTPMDAMGKAIGFQPNVVAKPRRAERYLNQDVTMAKKVEGDIAELWARGIFEKDDGKVAEAVDMMNAWNRKNPDTPINLTNQQLKQRVRAMHMTSGQRLLKSTPKEIRGYASEALRQ